LRITFQVLSDWDTRTYGWETSVEDLKVVPDAKGSDQFTHYGQSRATSTVFESKRRRERKDIPGQVPLFNVVNTIG